MLKYLETLTRCSKINNVWNLHCDKMAEYGFDRIVYGYTQFISPKSIGALNDILFLSNHTTDYFHKYMSKGYYNHAPLLDWALSNTGAISWGLAGEQSVPENDVRRDVVSLNKSYGIDAGYSISFRNATTRSRGVIFLAARQEITQEEIDEMWCHKGDEIEMICNIAHLKIITLPYTGTCDTLTPRQIEVLEWVSEGKTNHEIAKIMGLSQATVEKHLRLARDKMNVETTAQAVVKASLQHQMFLVSDHSTQKHA